MEDEFKPNQVHREYSLFKTRWEQIHACLDGQEAIKKEGERYLPYPVSLTDEDRKSDEFKSMYNIYIEGSHFVEYTAEAVEDLVSSAFRRPLTFSSDEESIEDDTADSMEGLPEGIDYLDINDIAKELTSTVGAYGRAFFFVDYPTAETSPTMADDGENKAYVSIYEPLDVLNWVEDKRTGKSVLVDVTLREIDELASASEDGIGQTVFMYRRLYIDKGTYKIDIYRPDAPNEKDQKVTLTPSAAGEDFKEIPGMFVGTTSNTANVDKSPVIGISNSNIKHYQTWADLMHVQVYTGSPQMVLTGLTPGWNKRAKEKGTEIKVKLDAANVLALEGEKSSAQLLQIDTNSLVHFRTLEILETAMLEEGAKIKSISKKAGVESAQALKIRSSSSMSKLSSIVSNVEEGLNLMIRWVGQYMAVEVDTRISVNTEFFAPEPDGDLMASISTAEASGTAPRGTTITYLKQIELVDEKQDTVELLKNMELCSTCTDTAVERDSSGNVTEVDKKTEETKPTT